MHNELDEWNRVRQFSHRSREWWTYDRQKYRSPFGSDGIPVPVSHQLSDHATADEIANVIAGTAKLWRDMGKQVKAANRASPLPKFTHTALYALPHDQQKQVLDGMRLKEIQCAAGPARAKGRLYSVQLPSTPPVFHRRPQPAADRNL